MTYLQASHFLWPDIGPVVEDDNHTLFATGRYEDTWAKSSDGTWKIVNRNFVFMVRSPAGFANSMQALLID